MASTSTGSSPTTCPAKISTTARNWKRCSRLSATATPSSCTRWNRLARNLDDLRATVRNLTTRGVRVQFMKEQLTFNGDDTAIATLMLSVMGAFAEFERALIKERQREGTALAKQRGAYRDRRKALTADQVDRLRAGAGAGEPKAALAREFGISRETVYQYLRADT